MKKYQVLSPDGFTIEHDHAHYPSLKQAKLALLRFVSKYTNQGFYSQVCSNGYRRKISVNELPDYCEIRTI